jgi:hypothetical protein
MKTNTPKYPGDPRDEEWQRMANALARGFAPTIYACKSCGYPAIEGYSCTTCGNLSPRDEVEKHN